MFLLRRFSKVVGSVDDLLGTSVRGWAANRALTNDILDIVVLADGKPIGQGSADQHRPDLLAAGYGNGNHGFVIPVTDIPPKPFSLSVVAITRSRFGRVRRTPLPSVTGGQVAKALLAKATIIHLPDPVSEFCNLIAAGRMPSAVSSDSAAYFSDDLLPKTLISFAQRTRSRQ